MRVLLVAYDNDSYTHYFPQGLAYIASALLRVGCEVDIYSQDKNHYPEEHLTQFLNKNKYDVVGIGVIAGYYQYRKLLKISDAINKSIQRPFYILGGHGPAPEPAYFMKKTGVDAVVIGEGELTIVELIDAIANHKPFSHIKGIVYRDGEKIIINERRALIGDIDSIPLPAYHLFPIDYYKLLRPVHADKTDFAMPVLSGRGCKFNCNFCFRLDKGLRIRSNAGIIEEVQFLRREYGINYIDFSDELLLSSVDRAIGLCEDFIKADLGIKWACNGRLNFAVPEVLQMMKRAGCVFINYGIEAMDDQVLRNMHKALTCNIILKGIEATLAIGISPGLNIIWGNIGDNKETLRKDVEFLLKYDDGAQLRTIRPVTPYPGSPLYYYAIEKGMLKDCEDFYEHKHINSDLVAVNFTDLNNDEFHQCLLEANEKLITNFYNMRLRSTIEEARKLYLEKDASFRGFRQI